MVFLTGGRIREHELYFPLLPSEWSHATQQELKSLILRDEAVWVFSHVMPEDAKIRERVFVFCAQLGRVPMLVKRFSHHYTGQPLYSGYVLRTKDD